MDDTEPSAPQQAIILTIRPSSGSTFTTAISTDSTVFQLKEKLATSDLPASAIRLVYSGRVLKDEDQLAVYYIMEGHTIHMVKSAANRANEQAVQSARPLNNSSGSGAAAGPGGFDESALMATLLENPAIRDMMANPEVVRRMMMANPQTREVMENNPEVAQMLNDPSFLRQSLDMARNPKLMKQALRNNDRAMSNLEMIPGGFNHLRRMYHNVQEPMEASRSAPEPSTDDLNEQFAARLNADTQPAFPGMPPGMADNSTDVGGFNQFANPFGGAQAPGAGLPRPSGAQPQQMPFNPWMAQRMGGFGGGPQSNPFGFPGMGGEGGFLPPLGNNPESFQQMMQFSQMMRQMQQQQPQPSGAASRAPPSFAQLNNMYRGVYPESTDSVLNTQAASNNNTSTVTPGDLTASATPSQTPEERFETQLASLRDMGFSDNSRNLRALLASGGDVNSAIEFLLRM
ncbi:hypothetical protein BGZ98_001052 [Dissophora globulifera]|nr:hypothetical protein BGZ98_001052 [Dissophora globulifera]